MSFIVVAREILPNVKGIEWDISDASIENYTGLLKTWCCHETSQLHASPVSLLRRRLNFPSIGTMQIAGVSSSMNQSSQSRSAPVRLQLPNASTASTVKQLVY